MEYEQSKMKELCDSESIDLKYFWYLVNRNKPKKGNKIHPIKFNENEMITDTVKIKESWAEHFQELLKFKVSDKYDNHHQIMVENEIERIEQQSAKNISFKAVQLEEVEQVIMSLKCKKVPGPDNLAPEYIKYGGTTCSLLLTIQCHSSN